MVKVEDVKQVIEGIDKKLVSHTGTYGAPLAYVVCHEVEIDEKEDPGVEFPPLMSELVLHTCHDGDEFETDSVAVWHIICCITHNSPAWNCVEHLVSKQDGQMA